LLVCTYECCLFAFFVVHCCLFVCLFVCTYYVCAVGACAGLRVYTSSCGTRNSPRCARHVCSWWARACGGLLLPLCSCSRCARFVNDVFPLCSCARGRGRGVVVFWSCACGCHVLALCSHLSCARVVCDRARDVFALFVLVFVLCSRCVCVVQSRCARLLCARVVLVFVVFSRCARTRGVLTLSSYSWCARVELVIVMCSRCARNHDMIILCSCSWCARVVSQLQNMSWPLGFASFSLVFLSPRANTPHCTHANTFAPIRSRPRLFWYFFYKTWCSGKFPRPLGPNHVLWDPKCPLFSLFCCALVLPHPTASIKTHPRPFAPIFYRSHLKLRCINKLFVFIFNEK
jgi:hypothetical protein